MNWRTVTRCVPGSRHMNEGLSCQDYGGDRTLNQVLIGAVADGAGSAAHAEVGAQLATTIILDYLEASEKWLQKQQSSWLTLPNEHVKEVAQEFFTKAVKYILKKLDQQVQANRYEMQDVACTLIAFVATPHSIAAMQIGDGFIVVRLKDQNYTLMFQPDKGEYANQTTFLTSPNALSTMKTQVVFGSQSFICAATDGLESVAIRRSDWTPFSPFFNPLEEFMAETVNPDQNDGYLVDFLTSERLNQRTNDDKTILLCLYP